VLTGRLPRTLLSVVIGGSYACSSVGREAPPARATGQAAAAPATPDPDFVEPLCPAPTLVSREEALASLDRSAALWHDIVQKWGDSYGYLRSAHLEGHRYHHTYQQVQDGAVVERRCMDPTRNADHAYYEPKAKLGTHDECHDVLTVEALHDECRALITQAPSRVHFASGLDGLLGVCALPGSCCTPESATCLTLRAVFPFGQAPCVVGNRLESTGSRWRLASDRPFTRDCYCQGGLVACDD
jgi:hypothetical protein